jgi:hypothetical protein
MHTCNAGTPMVMLFIVSLELEMGMALHPGDVDVVSATFADHFLPTTANAYRKGHKVVLQDGFELLAPPTTDYQ